MQKTVLYALFLLFVISCNDKDDDLETPAPAKTCRLAKLIQGTHNGAGDDTTLIYNYDAAGKITSVTYQQPSFSDTHNIAINYDDLARVIKVNNAPQSLFTYTAGGLLNEMIFVSRDTLRYQFIYGSSTLPEKCKRHSWSSVTKKWDSTIQYNYTFQNGNMVTKEGVFSGVSKYKEYYDYDTITNVSKNLNLIARGVPMGIYEEFAYFNKNMIKKARGWQSGYYIDYKTDSGRITKSFTYGLSAPNFTDTIGKSTRTYYYDCQ